MNTRGFLLVLLCGAATSLLMQGVAHALDKPIAELLEDNVTVTTTVNEVRALSTVAAANSFDTVFISNSSTTCIRVGGSTVTASRGAIIGSGCYDGSSINVDAKRVWLIAEAGGPVANVRLLFGVRQ